MVPYEKEPSVEWASIVEYSLHLGKLMMQTGRYTDAERIFNEHIIGGKVVNDYVIGKYRL